MIYPRSFLTATVIKNNSLVFNFLWNARDKVTRPSTYSPYDSGGLTMIDYIKPWNSGCRVLWFLDALSKQPFIESKGKAILT